MKKGLKVGGIVAGILMVLFLSLVALAKLLITPERVKKTVIPLAEKSLHRQVRLSDIEVKIFSGIVLKNLVVAEKDGGAVPLVRAEQVRLRYQFWPLLFRRVVVDEIRLDAPQISVVRLPDGTFNFSDLAKKKEGAPAAEPKEREEVNLLVSRVGIERGAVRYEDRNKDRPMTYTVGGIDFLAKDISPDKPFSFKGKAAIPGAVVELEGQAADIARQASLDAVVQIPGADLKKLAAGLPAEIAGKLRRLDPSGTVTARLHLAGVVAKPKEMLKDGEVKLEKVQALLSGQRPVLDGEIALKGDTVSSRNLTLALGQNRLDIAFTAGNILGKPLTLSSTVKADRFDLDPFLGPAKGTPAGKSGAARPEPGPLNLPVRATGTLQIGQTSYKGLPVTQFLLKYRLADNILTIDDLRGRVAGGTFADTAQIDLNRKGFAYATRLKVEGVQANPVVSAFAPKAANTVFGTLSLNGELKGSGTQGAVIKQTLGGQGDFAIANGKLTGAGLVEGLAGFINLEELRVLQFSRFAGTYRIVNGKVLIDSNVTGKDLQIAPKGTAGLDKSLDLTLVTRISPALAGKLRGGQAGRFIADEQGWSVIPLRVGGTVTSPRFRLDAAAVSQQMKGKAKEQIQKTIEEKLLKKKEGEPPRPEQEILEKGLKGIFGK